MKLPQGKLFLKLAINALLVGLEEIPVYGVAVKIGRSCWKILQQAQDEAAQNERIEQLEQAGAYTPIDARVLANEVIAEQRASGMDISADKAEAVADLIAAMPA